MPIESDEYEFPLTLRVPKKAFVIVASPPATVTQRTSELHFGIPPRLYREMYRDGLFPAKRLGRLIFAAYDDVKHAVTAGAVARAKVEQAIEAAVVDPEHDAPMSIESARTYPDMLRSYIPDRAWDVPDVLPPLQRANGLPSDAKCRHSLKTPSLRSRSALRTTRRRIRGGQPPR